MHVGSGAASWLNPAGITLCIIRAGGIIYSLASPFLPAAENPPFATDADTSTTTAAPDNAASPTAATRAPMGDLFGKAPTTSDSAELTIPVSQSSDLSLLGTLTAPDDADALAMIADKQGMQSAYSVGEELPGGATLQSVGVDHVIISVNGKPETLMLDEDAPRTASNRRNTRSAAPVNNHRSNARVLRDKQDISQLNLAQVRAQIMQNPAKIAGSLRPIAVTDNSTGKLVGVRLSAGRNNAILSKIGLRPSDIITSVNGIELDDPARAAAVIAQLQTAQQLTVTLQRDGQSKTQVVDLRQ